MYGSGIYYILMIIVYLDTQLSHETEELRMHNPLNITCLQRP